MIKITGGSFKKQSVETISKFVRPTSSLKREAFFSILDSHILKYNFNLYEKTFLDLFAGVGTMGLEAISRGMKKVIFYENNLEVIKILKKNCKKFCKENQYKIIEKNIITSDLKEDYNNISIVYIDPPYKLYNISKILLNLENNINKDCIVAIETSIDDNYSIPNNLRLLQSKKYGRTNINFLKLS
tara:strand:+ start:161 stop:718 length:558 start_codon:yes stop_codon:yes gene_type:complete